jgi:hypothetical protein
MNRTVIIAIGKLCGEALLITGALVIIGSLSSRMAAGQEWDVFLRLDSPSFRGMSPAERASFIVEASSSLRLVIVGLLGGISLILISLLVWGMF